MSNDPNGEFPKNIRTHAITKSQAEEIMSQARDLVSLACEEARQDMPDPRVDRAWIAFEARVRALVSP